MQVARHGAAEAEPAILHAGPTYVAQRYYTTWHPHITRTLTRTPHPHHSRPFFMQCNNCGARRSVQPIKTGFVAIGKGARKKNRTG